MQDEAGNKAFNKYGNVVIDVFSGASAGFIAPAIMLRGLAAFLDTENTSDFDRVIVFVSPGMGDEATNFRLPFYNNSVYESHAGY